MQIANIRDAKESDTLALTGIYAHHVRHGSATFEIDPPDCAEMSRRRTQIQERGLPYLVIEVDGLVAGYAYANQYRPRPAYRFTVEDSIYIHPDFLGRGFGNSLLAQVIECCEETRYRQMIAIIGDRANIASIRLHEKFGFRPVGVLEKVGRKFGRWIDTVVMQRPLYVDARLTELRRVMERGSTREQTLQLAADFLRLSGNHRWIGLYEVDAGAGEVRNLVFSGPGAPAYSVFSIDKGLTGRAVRERRTVNCPDVSSDPAYLTALGTTRSEIIVPVFGDGRETLIGTIDVESDKPGAFSDVEEVFLEECAELIRVLL